MAFRRAVLSVAWLLLAGCSEPEKRAVPPQPVSALPAFRNMFFAARSWAADAEPLRVAEIDVSEVKPEGGKAGAWEAVFVSLSQGRMQRCIFSVVHRPARNLRAGVSAEPPIAWTTGSGTQPFPVQAIRTDSTAAYKVALEHGRQYAAKHPGEPVKFLLERTHRFPNPAWRVFWGESVSMSGYSVFVDATTGEYLGTGR